MSSHIIRLTERSSALATLALALTLACTPACLFTDAQNSDNNTNNTPSDMSGGNNTSSADMGMTTEDMPEDMACQPTPIDPGAACAQAGIECGEIMIDDGCGNMEEFTCTCGHPEQTCSGEGMCVCTESNPPPVTCANEDRGGACGEFLYDAGCGVMELQECGTTCPEGLVCDEENKTCVTDTPNECGENACDIADRECGTLPACPGIDCGVCGADATCNSEGQCVEDAPTCGSRAQDDVCGLRGEPNSRCLSMYAPCPSYEHFACGTCAGGGCSIQTHCTELVLANPANAEDGFGTHVLLSENVLFVSAPRAGDGKIYLYQLSASGATKTDELDASMLGAGIDFSDPDMSLAISDRYLFIALPSIDYVVSIRVSQSGTTPKFERTTARQVQTGIIGPTGATIRFGASMATLDTTTHKQLIIGAPGYVQDKVRGAAFVCDAPGINSVIWTCGSRIDNPLGDERYTGFGEGVALAGFTTQETIAFIGAPNNTFNGSTPTGSVWAFQKARTGNTWSAGPQLNAPTGHLGFGEGLYWSPGTLYIASVANASNSTSYISRASMTFADLSLTFQEEKEIQNQDVLLGEHFAGNGTVIIASGAAKEQKEGAAFLYDSDKKKSMELHPSVDDVTSGTTTSFGANVGINAGIVVIGAPDYEINGDAVGEVFIMEIPDPSAF